MNRKALIAGVGLLLAGTQVMAQYPQITQEANEAYKAKTAEAKKLEAEAWEKALVIVREEAKHGRPYIPFAHRPTDLPQAKIPAFPGAEGGGMYSFGGRGGKVITVT
ncbi:MAG: polysaccharide lyase, partial [Bacteroides sp.]|nr:polysaccharide lyase [Bacteroides sp.]